MLYQVVSNVADKVELFVEGEMTVAEVRVLVGAMIGADERNIRLTFQGHVLEDDAAPWDAVLRTYPLVDGVPRKLFAYVSGRQRAEAPSGEALRAALLTTSNTAEEERAARENARMMEPVIDMMVRNPGFLDMLISTQPELKEVIKGQPDVERLLRDPDTMKTLMMSRFDPDRMRSLSRDMQLQFAHISATPGGEQRLQHYTEGASQSIVQALESAQQESDGGVDEALARPDPNKKANDEALPNPWANQSSSSSQAPAEMNTNAMRAILASSGGGGSRMPFLGPPGHAPPAAARNLFSAVTDMFPQGIPPVSGSGVHLPGLAQAREAVPNDAVRWAAQLSMLKDMGFEDEALCIEALRATNGDVDKAVGFIVDRNS
ncbi:ubiquilin [Trypanosoma grayi]|uniref:ubiquilin n=1 Tax=Trypanosoma grayi TaxID=71804 RepID=UPI0004F42334|nr:ubiquilin [Trypanosoma grayi]KEG09690.1 ubiquilin [Trypanosoma grayi]